MKQAGFATLLILILLVTLSLYGLEEYIGANAVNRMARREVQARQAVYTAEAGIEWAKAQLERNPAWENGTLLLSQGQVQVVASRSGEGFWVTSTSEVGLAQRKIKVFLQQASGQWMLTHYSELHS